MCEPTTIALAGLALSAVGTGVSAVSGMQARKATQRAADESMRNTAEANKRSIERAKATNEQQSQANQQIAQTVTQAPEKITEVAGEQDQAAQIRAAQYRAASPAATGYLPGQTNAPQVVRDAMDAERAKTAAVLGQQADALGAMRGWGDTMFGINRTVAQTGESVARQADAARGNARVAAAGAESDARNAAYQQAVDNYRMGLATQTGAGLRAVGDIAKGAGNLGVSYGMNPSGWAGLFGGPAVPASASAVASTGRAAGPV